MHLFGDMLLFVPMITTLVCFVTNVMIIDLM
jgi:hypothetical protein